MHRGLGRKRYVLMFEAKGKSMFATATNRDKALRAARRLRATVYMIPADSEGAWDCPTIRATFSPIYTPKPVEEG